MPGILKVIKAGMLFQKNYWYAKFCTSGGLNLVLRFRQNRDMNLGPCLWSKDIKKKWSYKNIYIVDKVKTHHFLWESAAFPGPRNEKK